MNEIPYRKKSHCFFARAVSICLFIVFSHISPPVFPQEALPDTEPYIEEAALILSEYVSYPSVTGTEKPAAEYFIEQCRRKGLFIRVFSDEMNSYNFAASLYPLSMNKPNIILLSHIDVVKGGDPSGWDHPPFSGDIFRDTVWGRGTLDMKEAAVMQLLAVSSFVDRAATVDLPLNITLLCVSGEESFGSTGSEIISNLHLPELNPVLVLGEGGIGTRGILSSDPDRPVFIVSLSDKRVLWLKLHLFYESSGHGAITPDQYANKMMINALSNITSRKPPVKFNSDTRRMFKALGKLEGGVKGFVLANPGIFKPIITGSLRKDPLMLSTVTNTITITRFFNQETDVNQIPQSATVYLDCRLLPETGTLKFIEDLSRELDNNNIMIEIINETINAPATVPGNYITLLSEALSETYENAATIPVLFPATTDNNFFRAKGVPSIGLIPICIGQELLMTLHNFNERVPVEALVKGTETYRLFIEKLLLAGE